MRVEVNKFLFFGAEKDREVFFREAQHAGVIEFIDSQPGASHEHPPVIDRLSHARKVLLHLEPVPQEELESLEAADGIASQILALNETIEKCFEEERLLKQEIERVRVFGDFSTDDISYLEGHHRAVQFFFSKQGAEVEGENLFYVGSAFDHDYYVAINAESHKYEGATEMHIERPLGELKKRLDQVIDERHDAETRLKTYAKRRDYLQHALIRELNHYNLLNSQEYVAIALDGKAFAVEGWVPRDKVEQVNKVADRFSVQHYRIKIEEKDHVPTFLENEGFARVGEDIVHIYDTPSTHDRDPSRWVLWFFAFFFAVIMGDAGYGLILLVASLLLAYKFRRQESRALKRFFKLCLILTVSCVIWGLLTSSFFGIDFAPDNPIRKISLTDWLTRSKIEYVLHYQGDQYKEWLLEFPQIAGKTTAEDAINAGISKQDGVTTYKLFDDVRSSILLELSILIGVIHVILSFARVIDRNWAGAGWIIGIIGGYLYFPKFVKATSIVAFLTGLESATLEFHGLELLCIGVGLAIILALIQNRLGGATEILNIIQIFADILSYLRLYALALAAAMLALTFNQLAAQSGWVFGIVIILIGHTVNIALSIMGGVIHGLRLNFLEWYRHCFEGGGKMLHPLQLIEIPLHKENE